MVLADISGSQIFSNKMSSTLLGHEILIATDMPGIAEDHAPVMFGDFKRTYQILDRHNIRILRDPFTHKPFIKFYATKTVGGDVINDESIAFLKLKNKILVIPNL